MRGPSVVCNLDSLGFLANVTMLRLQAFKEMINPRTKLVALVYVSNMLGAVTRVHDVVSEARKVPDPEPCWQHSASQLPQ